MKIGDICNSGVSKYITSNIIVYVYKKERQFNLTMYCEKRWYIICILLSLQQYYWSACIDTILWEV